MYDIFFKVGELNKVKKWLKNNWIYIIVITIIIMVMIFFIAQKEGYHEDEMFSYGSSSYLYDNVYRSYGKMDATNDLVTKKIINGNLLDIIKNIKYYCLDHPEEREAYFKEFNENKRPIWRSSEEANDYLTLGKGERGNYLLVYYNQARDVHPPLFYFAVHTVALFFFGNFSKAIIGIVNIIFMIASLFTIKRIFEILDKKHLIIPGLVFYGLSMGAISTAVFQRMYAMLTFFVLEYILININIEKSNFEIDKKTWIKLGTITILGFLTQYYFCIIALLIAVYVFIRICLKKDTNKIYKYVINYFKIALIGVLIYPFSINHMFFSYRGVGKSEMTRGFIEKFIDYCSLIGYSYTIPAIVLSVIILLSILLIIIRKLQKKEKIFTNQNNILIALGCSFLLYIAVVVKVSPELNYTLRYIMSVLPLFSILFIVLIDACFSNKKISKIILNLFVIVVSVYGLVISKPEFLFKGYNKYLEIAEENKHTSFVYVGSTLFNQIQSMPEFAIYDESLILEPKQIYLIATDEKLKKENEFIMSVKKYKDPEAIIEEIINTTEFKKYELLLDDDGDIGCKIYRIKR